MSFSAVKRLQKLEIYALYSLIFFLPIMESPKHLAFALFFIGALGWRLLEKPVGWRKPDIVEYLLVGMLLVSLASTMTNWPIERGFHGFKDLFSMLFLFWALYNNTYKESQIRLLLWIIILAVMLGLVEGLWEWKSGLRGHLEFHSAGVVTQSAIYLGISMFLMFGVFLDTVSGFSNRVRLIIVVCLLFSLFCLIIMGNRGSVLAVIVIMGVLSLILFHNRRFRIALEITLLVAIVMIISSYIGNGNSILKERTMCTHQMVV